jgi:hypothetical protein
VKGDVEAWTLHTKLPLETAESIPPATPQQVDEIERNALEGKR